jgi:endonuclease G
VILDYTEPELKAIGFILPNKKSKAPLQSFAISVDSVEIQTGIDFFYNLPDDKENKLESNVDVKKWSWE